MRNGRGCHAPRPFPQRAARRRDPRGVIKGFEIARRDPHADPAADYIRARAFVMTFLIRFCPAQTRSFDWRSTSVASIW